MKETLYVNLFAGPGTGKSTCAAYIFSKLKMEGYDVELVTEFAKDKVWEHNSKVFECQMYMSGKQLWKLQRCNGEVDIVITDSPIQQGVNYVEDGDPLKDAIEYSAHKFNNLNIFLNREKEYNPNGRNQTEEEAKELDKKIKHNLNIYGHKYDEKVFDIDSNIKGYDFLFELIKAFVSRLKFDPDYLTNSDSGANINTPLSKEKLDELMRAYSLDVLEK